MKLPHTYTKDKTIVNAIIETPANSRNKFAYEKKSGLFKLTKVLPAGLSFPCEMGFVPHTIADDGDALDILVLMDGYTYPGCVIECRLLGIIKGEQKEKKGKPYRNDRIIAVPSEMRDQENLRTVKDIGSHKLNAIIKFMEYYNMMEDKEYKLVDVAGPESAYESVRKHKKNKKS